MYGENQKKANTYQGWPPKNLINITRKQNNKTES